MSAFDRVRRVVTVLLVAATLLVAPHVAFGAFSTPRTSSLSVAAASLTVPTSVQASGSCSTFLFWENFEVTISSFTDPGPAGRAYTYTFVLERNGREVATSSGTAKSAQLSTGTVGRGGSYTVRIESALGSWLAPTYEISTGCRTGSL